MPPPKRNIATVAAYGAVDKGHRAAVRLVRRCRHRAPFAAVAVHRAVGKGHRAKVRDAAASFEAKLRRLHCWRLTVLLVRVNVPPLVRDAAAARGGVVAAHRAVGKSQCATLVVDATAVAGTVATHRAVGQRRRAEVVRCRRR